MLHDESPSQIPSISCTDEAEQELKLQDHHQMNVHIPEGNISHPASLDPILEQSAIDLHVIQDNAQGHDHLVDDGLQISLERQSQFTKGLEDIEHAKIHAHETAINYKKPLKEDEEDDDEKEEKKKKKSYNQQRAVWHPPTSDSGDEILETSNSDVPIINKKHTLLQKLFKGDGPVGDSPSISKHDSQSIKSTHSYTYKTERADSIKHEGSFKNDDHCLSLKDQIAKESSNLGSLKIDDPDSNVSISQNSEKHHNIQMLHFPDSQSRDHWITSNHREHKHESLLSKIFYSRHDSDHEHKIKVEGDLHTSTRNSTTDEPKYSMNTSTSSVEGVESRNSIVGQDLQKPVISPPPDMPKIEYSFSNKLGRLLSRKKKHIEDKDMTSNLIKELVSAQIQIQRTDTQSSQMTNTSIISSAANSDICLTEKYGHLEEVIGKGAQATVRLAHLHTANKDKLWAVKEFRKRKKDESNRDYAKRVVSEFCISSTLKHENVIETVDLIKDEHGKWCEVMEYVAGGDLFNKISKGKFYCNLEIACFFKQFLSGINYIHSAGIAHRDLKPENILLDTKHELLKITDFGVAAVVRKSNEQEAKLSRGIAGSDPYIAPEMWECDEYDAFKTDAWSCGILLYAMYTKTILWKAAKSTDDGYKAYRFRKTDTCMAIEKLPSECRTTMYGLLELDPSKRSTVNEALNGEWMSSTEKCSSQSTASSDGSRFMHRHAGPGQ